MTADDPATCEILGGHSLRLRAVALALRGPPLQWLLPTLCAKPNAVEIVPGVYHAVKPKLGK